MPCAAHAHSTEAVEASEAPSPESGQLEVGGLAELLFISPFHNLRQAGYPQYRFNRPSMLVGGRGAYFFDRYLAVEAELSLGLGSVGKRTSPVSTDYQPPSDAGPAVFVPVRVNALLQLPAWRLTPFALLGTGFVYAHSSQMKGDTDVLFDLGVGAKYYASARFIPRLDLRLDMTQREGGSLGDGVALHGEIALGLSFLL